MLHSGILLPPSLDSVSILHSQCTFSTPWGVFWPVTILQECTCQLTHNNVCILPGPHLIYTWVESSNVDTVSTEGQKYQAMVGIEPVALLFSKDNLGLLFFLNRKVFKLSQYSHVRSHLQKEFHGDLECSHMCHTTFKFSLRG